MDASEAVIQVGALVKRWSNGRGVHGIDLRVKRGEVLGFLGPNGAGKTTTIRVLMGFARATAGRATVLGLDCWRGQDEIRRRAGYVAGDVKLPAHLRVGEFLNILSRVRGVDTSGTKELCERLELDPGLPIRTLSKGNRQKVTLVAALAHRPPVLVLDEPTSGLDPLLQQRFLELLAEARERGQAVLLSSHQLDEVQRVCDRVAIVREGLLVTEATVENLRAQSPRRLVVFDDRPVAPPPGLGVRALSREGRRQEFLVVGALPAVFAWLAECAPLNVELAPATLQDLFLNYYDLGEVKAR